MSGRAAVRVLHKASAKMDFTQFTIDSGELGSCPTGGQVPQHMPLQPSLRRHVLPCGGTCLPEQRQRV